MTFRGDPYLALGLPPTASLTDVKRAYRVLAKRHHPDAAKGSVARFLEIQAAYEMLVRPDHAGVGWPVTSQPTGRRQTAPGMRSSGPRRPAGERPPSPPRASQEPGTGQAAGRGRRRRNPRTATLGSTTYDEAAEVAEPAWDGADWYGPTSGTYWTVNPKEYADPRKHGPEYLARSAAARHPRGRVPPPTGPEPGSPPGDRAEAGARNDPPPERGAGVDGPAAPRESAASQAGQPSTAAPRRAAAASPAGQPSTATGSPAGQPSTAATASADGQPPNAAPRRAAARSRVAAAPDSPDRHRTARSTWPGPAERLVAGLLGWLPFGLLLAAAAGTPGGLLGTLPLQAVGLAGMLWAPRLAWASAGGLAAVIACAIPGVATLAALGVGVRPAGPAPVALVVLAALAWSAGAALASSGRLIGPPWRAAR